VTALQRTLEIVARGAPRPARLPSIAGCGDVEVVRAADGRSVVARAYATSPLRLLTPINHGHAAWIYGSSYGGGLVDGDSVAMEIAVGAGAAAFVSTQAFTKVYRSFRGTRAAAHARVERGGLLVFAPDPVVCYSGARYQQWQRVDVDGDGALILVDWVTSGRRAAGERWQFDQYLAHTEVRVQGTLVLHDRLLLCAAHGDLGARLGRFDVLALVVLAGGGVSQEAARLVSETSARPLERRPALLVSAAPLGDGGCALRLAGRSVEQVGDAIRRLLAFVPPRLGDDPWARKW